MTPPVAAPSDTSNLSDATAPIKTSCYAHEFKRCLRGYTEVYSCTLCTSQRFVVRHVTAGDKTISRIPTNSRQYNGESLCLLMPAVSVALLASVNTVNKTPRE